MLPDALLGHVSREPGHEQRPTAGVDRVSEEDGEAPAAVDRHRLQRLDGEPAQVLDARGAQPLPAAGRGGVLVNISSGAATLCAPGEYVQYAAAKAGVDRARTAARAAPRRSA